LQIASQKYFVKVERLEVRIVFAMKLLELLHLGPRVHMLPFQSLMQSTCKSVMVAIVSEDASAGGEEFVLASSVRRRHDVEFPNGILQEMQLWCQALKLKDVVTNDHNWGFLRKDGALRIIDMSFKGSDELCLTNVDTPHIDPMKVQQALEFVKTTLVAMKLSSSLQHEQIQKLSHYLDSIKSHSITSSHAISS
jgi:hypothetical protein